MEKQKIYIIIAVVVGFIFLFIQLPIGLLVFIGIGIYGVVQIVKNRKKKPEEKKAEIKESKSPKTKTIQETKCTCNACGKVWHYGKQDKLQNFGAAMGNCGKASMCCGGCVPALLIPDKKVVDLTKCPECGSKNIKSEIVEYEVNR